MENLAGVKLSSKQAMRLAIQYAQKGLGFAAPNPPVGCVILDKNHCFLSAGCHARYGSDHAEISALKKIKDRKQLTGAFVFVTLEPCHHQGQTPSCAHQLARFNLASLTYGAEDPFTQKRGLKFLKQNNISVQASSYFQEELEDLIAHFKFSFLNKKPFVSLKAAVSLDGQLALNKKKEWITGPRARAFVHVLRAMHTAVLIGADTFIQDNPRLNIRSLRFKKKNKVIILDPHGKTLCLLPQSRLLQTHSPKNIFLVCFKKYVRKKTPLVRVLKLSQKFSSPDGQFHLPLLLSCLYREEGLQSILVEGGARCFSEFLKQKSAQRLYLHIAPKVLGEGLRWTQSFKAHSLSAAPQLERVKARFMKPDFILEGALKFES